MPGRGAASGRTEQPVDPQSNGAGDGQATSEDRVVQPESFNRRGIEKIPNDKPAVYRILTEGGRNNYTGIAQKGRVQERIREHLSGGKDPIPGSKVRVEQVGSIADARARESRIISRSRPTHNKLGK